MLVSFDSNIVIKDFWMDGIEFKAFISILERFSCKVILSSVLSDEVIEKYNSILNELYKKINGNEAKLLRIEPMNNLDFDGLSNKYQSFFEERISGLNRERTKFIYPDLALYDKAYQRLVSKAPPVKPNGIGFKDALIWECLKVGWRLYYFPHIPIYYITNDNDFSECMKSEIKELLGNDVRFEIFRSISDFNKSIAAKSEAINETAKSITASFLQKLLESSPSGVLVEEELKLYLNKSTVKFSIIEVEVVDNYHIYTTPGTYYEIKGVMVIGEFECNRRVMFTMFARFDLNGEKFISEFYIENP